MTTIEERADTITRGIWDARSSTGMDTYSALRDIVFKELAADEVRQASKREMARGPIIPPEPSAAEQIARIKANVKRWACPCLSCSYERVMYPGMKTVHDQ